jgi:hypothetical protein
MRNVVLLLLVSFSAAALAQSPTPPDTSGATRQLDQRTGENSANDAYQSCLNIWERRTHMSKEQWARACRRVADRLKTLKVE